MIADGRHRRPPYQEGGRMDHTSSRDGSSGTLPDAILVHGVLTYIRSDNWLEMTSPLLQDWLERVGRKRY
jgi:hypothetical protein